MARLKRALYESTTCVIWCRTRVGKGRSPGNLAQGREHGVGSGYCHRVLESRNGLMNHVTVPKLEVRRTQPGGYGPHFGLRVQRAVASMPFVHRHTYVCGENLSKPGKPGPSIRRRQHTTPTAGKNMPPNPFAKRINSTSHEHFYKRPQDFYKTHAC